jgi:hypothetical protein
MDSAIGLKLFELYLSKTGMTCEQFSEVVHNKPFPYHNYIMSEFPEEREKVETTFKFLKDKMSAETFCMEFVMPYLKHAKLSYEDAIKKPPNGQRISMYKQILKFLMTHQSGYFPFVEYMERTGSTEQSSFTKNAIFSVKRRWGPNSFVHSFDPKKPKSSFVDAFDPNDSKGVKSQLTMMSCTTIYGENALMNDRNIKMLQTVSF